MLLKLIHISNINTSRGNYMIHIKIKLNYFISVLIVAILLFSALLPFASAADISKITAFKKGPSFNPVVPIKKTIFVDFDTENLIDDYSYLAAVPTAVFNDENSLYSYPLLFYQDEYAYEDDKNEV